MADKEYKPTAEEEAEIKKFFEREAGNINNLLQSSMILSIVPGDGRRVPMEFLMQLGAAIYYAKPLIVCVTPGQKLNPRMYALADEVIEIDPKKPKAAEKATEAAIKRMLQKVHGIDIEKQ